VERLREQEDDLLRRLEALGVEYIEAKGTKMKKTRARGKDAIATN
jgi:isopropylmalate/homocitrate/citramalate synthase